MCTLALIVLLPLLAQRCDLAVPALDAAPQAAQAARGPEIEPALLGEYEGTLPSDAPGDVDTRVRFYVRNLTEMDAGTFVIVSGPRDGTSERRVELIGHWRRISGGTFDHTGWIGRLIVDRREGGDGGVPTVSGFSRILMDNVLCVQRIAAGQLRVLDPECRELPRGDDVLRQKTAR